MPPAKHVVLISIDGLKPEWYLDSRWPAPAMQQLYREGAHAVSVRPVFPALTYPGHTTLVTGALPARHGITNNRKIEPVPDPEWLCESSLIRVPALWDAVHASGGTCASILWPMTKGAPIDWNLPEIWPGGDGNLIDALRGNDHPRGLLEELEREACGRLTPENFNNKWIAHDLRVALIAEYLFERHRPSLLLVHTQASVQVPQEPDWRNPRRGRAIAGSDQVVSMILEVIERTKTWHDTAVIVAGDHGNAEVHTAIRPNIWLVEAGLRGPLLQNSEWRAAFYTLGGSGFLRLQPPFAENEAAVRRVLDALPPGVKETFRIVERDELDALGADPEAPFALAAAEGFVLDDRTKPPAMQKNPGMSHGHLPDHPGMHTGFLAKGAGIRAGTSIPMLPLTCVAPVVAALLGLEFDAPDGTVYPGLLDE